MDLHFKRRSLAESFVGKQLEAILGRQMTEKRVNGYPVPSTGIGNGNRTNGNTRQRLHGLSSSRGLSQSSMQLGQSISAAPTPENNSKSKPFGNGNGQGPKRVLRHYLSVDDSNIFRRPQQFRRATEKYVRPKSTFYIPSCAEDEGTNGGQGKNLVKSVAKSSDTNTANSSVGLLPSTRRQSKRVSSIHRRSASVDDLLSSNNRNSNLMSFSSDDEDEQGSRYFNQDASRSISAVTEVPAIRPIGVSSRTSIESATASSAAVTLNSDVAPANSVTPIADLPLSANRSTATKAALPPAVLPVRRTVCPKAAICPMFPGMLPITSRAIPGAVSMAPVPVIPAAVPTASPVIPIAGPTETTVMATTPGVCPVIPATIQTECTLMLDLVSAASPVIPAEIPGVCSVIPAGVPPTSLVIPAAMPASSPVQLSPPTSYEVAVAASPVLPLTPSRPIPAPRRFEPQQSYLDLIFDLMPTSSTATIATVPTIRPKPTRLPVQKPRSPQTRETPPLNPAPVVETPTPTPLLVDLSDPTPNQRPGTSSDSDIRSSSTSSRSSLAEETSESAGGHRIRDPPISGSSRSLDSIPSSSPGPEVTPRRMSLLESTRASASSSRVSNEGPDIECCDTPGSLSMYDKIVWFTESGVPETGMVKWLGRIKSTFYAGVEFENHVGNSSGKIKGRRLFTTALTKGRFVPITELMLHKDFYEGFPYPTNAPADPKIMPKATPQKFVSSVIMCVVCQEPLLNLDEDESAPDGSRIGSEAAAVPEQKEMIATPCGHLFHADCLKRWFNVNQKPRQPCPYCQNLMGVNEVIRIFPVQGKL